MCKPLICYNRGTAKRRSHTVNKGREEMIEDYSGDDGRESAVNPLWEGK